MREIYPYEDYVLMRSHVPTTLDDDGFERDLFTGVDA